MPDRGGVGEFVGRSRVGLVDGLVAVYDGVAGGRQPCWVSLEGPSGWGKTRVVHELFARLAGRQEVPRYWPAVIDDPVLGRKAAQPARFVRPKDAFPEFLWWGIACSNRQGLASAALAGDVVRLYAHKTYLDRAWKTLVPVRERARGGLVKAGRMVAEEGVLELAALGVEQVASAVVPGVGTAARLTRWSAKGVKHKLAERQDFASETVFDSTASSDVVDEVVGFLGRLAQAGFPVVIFVEDAHNADEVVLELLDRMLRCEGTVLVISTAWPDVAGINPAFGELMSEHENRLRRVGHTEPAGTPFPEDAGLLELETDARAAILHSYYPRVEAETKVFLLRRYVNPLALELFCQVEVYRTSETYRTTGGELSLPPEQREQLPKTLRDLYRALWEELPKQVRFALAVAHVLTPTNINPATAGGEDAWMDTLLRDVINNLDHLDQLNELGRDDIIAALAKAPNAHAWVRIIDDYLRAFAEDSQKDIAKNDGYEYLKEKLDDPREQILNKLTHILLAAGTDLTNTVNGARSILVLHAAGYITAHDTVAGAIEVLLADLEHNLRELLERLDLFDRFKRLDPPPTTNTTTFAIRQYGALALGEAGRVDEAIAECEDLLPEQLRVLGSEDPGTLFTRHILAGRLGEAGRVEEAVTALEQVLVDRLRVLGADHPHTLLTRHNLAGWIGAAGRVEEAITTYEEVLVDRLRVLGADHPHTLATRHNLAHWHGKTGRVRVAVTAYEEVLVDRLRVLGADHPHTLATRHNLAYWHGKTGRVRVAVTAYEEVLVDRLRVLGADHPHTLTTRNYLARWLGEAGARRGCRHRIRGGVGGLVAGVGRRPPPHAYHPQLSGALAR